MDDDLFLNISGLRPRTVPPASRVDLIRREQRHQAGSKLVTEPGKRRNDVATATARPPKRIKRSRAADAVPKRSDMEAPKQAVQSEAFENSSSKRHKRSKGSTIPVVAAQAPQERSVPKKRKKVKRLLDPAASTVSAQVPDLPQKTHSESKDGGPKERKTLGHGGIPSNADFKKLRLHESLARQLDFLKFSQCTPIQSLAVPVALDGRRDVLIRAATGSGKTLAFLLPASVYIEKQRLSNPKSARVPSPFVLVLAPTRELAVQIADEANKVFDGKGDGGKSDQVNTVAVYGGEDKFQQKKRLGWGADIVVATPGRLADFMNTSVLALGRVAYFVLDEADRMLDMGFQDEVADITKKLHPERQVLFFSATWNKEVQQLAQGLCRGGRKAVRISYGQDADAADGTAAKAKAREGIVQQVVVVDHPNLNASDRWEQQEAEKEVLMEKHLKSVLTASEEHKVLVFVSQKLLADKLSKRLQLLGFKADSMHGGKSQDYRLWVLDQFRKGELRLLVCTDVLGRGIDIPSVSHVVIHEMGEIEDYIHRIGRTARGQYGKGHALVFFEFWDGNPAIAAEFIEVLQASKQQVPAELRKIADEVGSGKRKGRVEGSGNWKTSFVPKSGSKWNAWGK